MHLPLPVLLLLPALAFAAPAQAAPPPPYATADTTLTGMSEYGCFGDAVAGVGDVNGDGYADVIVGSPGLSDSFGSATVYEGTADGLSTTPEVRLTETQYFGVSVAGAGDVNGDGYDDVIVGASGDITGSALVESAYVYLGSAGGLSADASTVLLGETEASTFGWSVSGAGDVNGDGYADVIVGAFKYSSYTGRAYVYHGSADGIVSAPATTLETGVAGAEFGYSVAGAGDVNGDGYADVIVGAPYEDAGYGKSYVFLGSAAGISTAPSTTLTGEPEISLFGVSVAGAGDVNGDGYADVIVGAPFYDLNLGRATVYLGSASGLSDAVFAYWEGDFALADAGFHVAGAGDVNGDGYDDVMMAENNFDTGRGKVLVYTGGPLDMDTRAHDAWTGEDEYNEFGWALAGAGDIDADGYDDAIVGAYGYAEEVGRVYLYRGGPDTDADGDGYSTLDDCDDGDGSVHPGASEVCNGLDDDCDGAPDRDAIDEQTWYADADGDGFTDPDVYFADCEAPYGYAAETADDCDDDDASRYPGASDVPGDGIDQDCDGFDADQDTGGPSGDDTASLGGSGTDDGKGRGCGCATGAAGRSLVWVLVAVGLVRRRRAWGTGPR